MGYECIPQANMKKLTGICNQIAEITNISMNQQSPYVGKSAFAHKAGMHIDAVLKNPFAYEHIEPETVGNTRVFLMSEVAGRATIIEKINRFAPQIKKNDKIVEKIIARMKELEKQGYQFEGADGSFELMVRKVMGQYQPFFKLHYYTTNGSNPRPEEGVCCCSQTKVEVDGKIEITAGEGDGPVNALDIALRKALEKFYPLVSQIRLVDYKVRVLDTKAATAAKVRVIIESTDGQMNWTTVGVSADLIEASWIALSDSFEYSKAAIFMVFTLLAIVPMTALGVSQFSQEVVDVEFLDDEVHIQAQVFNYHFKYESIEDLDIDPEFDKGKRIAGYGTPTICSGTFKNDVFGSYKLASYTQVKPCIFFLYEGKYYAFNQGSDELTQQAYEQLLSHAKG